MAFGNNRQNDIDAIPQEVQEYYQSERRERSGVAWLLALGTLVITLLLAVGLFFGGRWLWEKISNNEPDSVVTSQTDTPAPASTDDTGSDGTAAADNTTDDSSASATAPTTDKPDDSSATTSPPDAADETATTGTSAATETSTTESVDESEQVAGKTDQPEDLANTGPADTAAVFVGAVISGTMAYRLVWLRRYTDND